VTRKDFVLIADVLRIAGKRANIPGAIPDMVRLSMLANDMASELARTNGAFDRERFLKACGVTG
jgi:hypothetical protein